ncbi:MFS transporter [Candidatus Peregrinibacteria bacterium]|nr:MFS transporter [Candidatus Peregrinibacteria bacterium]
MFYKIRTHDRHPIGKFFAWMSLIVAIGTCLVSPVLPNFLKTVVHSDSNVSLFFSFLAIVTLFGGLGSGFIFRKVERTTITKWSLAILAFSTLAIIFVTKFISIAILLTMKIFLELMLQIVLALFIRDFSKANNLGKEESLRFRFQNIGCLIGLLVGGFLASRMNYETVFIGESLMSLFGLAYFHKKHIINSKKHPESNFLKNLKEFFINKERRKIYLISVIYMLWISFKYLYIPLYVANSGYSPGMSGLILSLAMIPAIVFEIKTGEFGKVYTPRRVITFGFCFIGIMLTIIFLSPWPLLNFGLLAITNTGAGLIEPLKEEYFLENTAVKDEDKFYGVYCTNDPISHFLTPLIGVVTFLFLPYKFVFIVFGIIMFLAAFFAFSNLKR